VVGLQAQEKEKEVEVVEKWGDELSEARKMAIYEAELDVAEEEGLVLAKANNWLESQRLNYINTAMINSMAEKGLDEFDAEPRKLREMTLAQERYREEMEKARLREIEAKKNIFQKPKATTPVEKARQRQDNRDAFELRMTNFVDILSNQQRFEDRIMWEMFHGDDKVFDTVAHTKGDFVLVKQYSDICRNWYRNNKPVFNKDTMAGSDPSRANDTKNEALLMQRINGTVRK